MTNLTTEDAKLLVEYINKKEDSVRTELSEEIVFVKEELTKRLVEELKSNPEFRGPIGYAGADGDIGPQGPEGPKGEKGDPLRIDIDEDHCRVRFQVGNFINEDTNEIVPHYSDWIDIKGVKGESGEQGPEGPRGDDGISFVDAKIHEDTLYVYNSLGEKFNLGEVRGPQGEPGPVGPKGEALTWHDLTESQRQLLVGPSGPSGPKGDPGSFPMVECDHEERKIRFQVKEDYTDPWGPWIDMPVGPQGEQGPAFVYEDFTQQQLMGLQGPTGPQGEKGDQGETGPQGPTGPRGLKGEKGDQGIQGEKGEKGDKGDAGVDADLTPIKDEVEEFKKKVVDDHTKFDKRLKDTTEKLRSEITNRISDVRFTRLNELLIPTASFSVAGDPSNNEIYQEVDVTNWSDIVNGSPIYIDNQIKASIRGDVYDPDNFLIYASAEHISQVADGIIVKGVNSKAYIYRLGVVAVDPKVIADGPELVPGEYYYLAHPTPNRTNGQITVNKPTYGVAQLVGQAISTKEIFVNTTTDPVILNRTNVVIQGRNGATLRAPTDPRGVEGDAFGDVIWTDTHYYFCVRDYDGKTQIWRRIATQSDW